MVPMTLISFKMLFHKGSSFWGMLKRVFLISEALPGDIEPVFVSLLIII